MKMKVFVDMTPRWWEFIYGCSGGTRYHHARV